MKKPVLRALFAALALSFAAGSANALVVTASNDANFLASTLTGPGITVSNAVLTTASTKAAGTFTGGSDIGFNAGVLLTTGTVDCAVGPNELEECGGQGMETSLKFEFFSSTGNVFFNYVFASDEYPEYVDEKFNDEFKLLLNGVNIALLPGRNGVVSINNVNSGKNSTYFRDNSTGLIDTEFDGLTTVLTASATGLVGKNTFEFVVRDIADPLVDSGVFIQAGTFSTGVNEVPEPGSLVLLGLGLMGLLAVRRKSKKIN